MTIRIGRITAGNTIKARDLIDRVDQEEDVLGVSETDCLVESKKNILPSKK